MRPGAMDERAPRRDPKTATNKSTRESDAGALKSFDICQSAAGRITAIGEQTRRTRRVSPPPTTCSG